MRHARAEALADLEHLLTQLRARDALKERTPGSFYYKSKGFLHFHEDPAGLFADLKVGEIFQRFEVTHLPQRQHLLDLVNALLTPTTTTTRPG